METTIDKKYIEIDTDKEFEKTYGYEINQVPEEDYDDDVSILYWEHSKDIQFHSDVLEGKSIAEQTGGVVIETYRKGHLYALDLEEEVKNYLEDRTLI